MNTQFKTFPVNTILIGLDLSALDQTLIRYASTICKYLPVERVYFIHVAKDLTLPEEIPVEFRQLLSNVDEGIKLQMERTIEANFEKRPGMEIHIEITEGNAIDKMLRYSRIKNIDMILLGRKKDLKGSGVVNNAIARKSPCHLLLVPEKERPDKLETIMLATDFSAHSRLALDFIISMKDSSGFRIVCNHIYSVPSGYSKMGKSFDEFAEIMRENAKKEFGKFINPLKNAIFPEFTLDTSDQVEDTIMNSAAQAAPDLIVIGSKGRSNISTVFMGSIAEKLSLVNTEIPLLIIKNKNESMGVFEALMKL